jgi:hypothetical protein
MVDTRAMRKKWAIYAEQMREDEGDGSLLYYIIAYSAIQDIRDLLDEIEAGTC